MQWFDPNTEQPVSFDKLVYIDLLKGMSAGSQRVMAVLGDPVWVALGNRSWFDLAHWLGEPGIESPYWTHWYAEMNVSRYTNWTMFRIAYEAQAHVQMDRAEDQVRFERALLRAF
jgi:hypothetical protein